jgi:hypothetical protein
MALGKRRRERQLEAFVAASDLPKAPGHPFYTALNLTHLGEPLEPPPVSPARGHPPTGASSFRPTTTGQSFRHRPTSCL